MRRAAPVWVAVAALPAAFLAVFFVYPVGSILARGFDGAAVVDVVTDRHLRGVAWFTLWQAVVSTAITVVAGVPGAWALNRYRFPGRTIVRAAVAVPFVLPTVVVAAAFTSLLGPRGPLAALRLHPSVWAILAAHVFFNYAVVVRTVGSVLSHLDPSLEDAARVLGATRWRAFAEVTLPLLRPAIASATSIVFLFTFTSFGVVLVLGGPARGTLEVEIWRQTTQLLRLDVAAALAIVQLAAVVAALAVYGRLQERTVAPGLIAPRDVLRSPRAAGQRAFLAANLTVIAILLGVPVGTLVRGSFKTGDGYGFAAWRGLGSTREGSVLFVAPLEALRNSLAFAVVATVIAFVVGSAASAVIAYRRGRMSRPFDLMLMLPLGTSAVTIGFGFLITLDSPPLDLRSSPWLIPIAHALVAVPFVVRSLVPVMRALDPRLRDAAAVLGAPPRRVALEIDVPLLRRASLVGAAFSFAVSLGEFGATLFIARPDYPTMPIAIFRSLTQPGALSFGQAMAMSTLLMLVTAASVLVIERLRPGAAGDF